MAPPPSSSTTPPSQILDHTSLPSESHTYNISAPEEELPSMRDISENTESTQTGFPFLSLPPEIRNMIYHYLFAPTCKTIMREALPVSLACMHIVLSHQFNNVKHISDALKVFLARTHQPEGVYLSVVTFVKYESFREDEFDAKHFSQLVNEADIRIGHLILCETTSGVYPNIGRYFVEAIEHLEHMPAKIEWTYFFTEEAYGYERQRVDFNAAAKRWLAQLAKVKKTADADARLPLLRDFLPQFFENTTD